jgi:F0F1-type ATP synthase membrane subunit b/b'
MLNEQFWLAAAFLVFCLIFFKKMKEFILSNLDQKIAEVEKVLSEAENNKKQAETDLINLKEKYEKTKLEAQAYLLEAKDQADKLMVETTEKIKQYQDQSDQLFIEYTKQADKIVVQSLKSEVIVTVLTLLDKDFDSKDEQKQSLELIKQLLKKSWH